MNRYTARAIACLVAIGGLLVGAVLAMPTNAAAADNSGIVIIEREHRSSGYGDYHRRRRTEIYGPSTGYRYEEYRYPPSGVIVYPRSGGYGYGAEGHRGPSHGRVIQQYGQGAYGRYGAGSAPAAPRAYGYAGSYRQHRHGRRYGDHRNGIRRQPRHGRQSVPGRSRSFGRDPSQRAIQPAQRAIR